MVKFKPCILIAMGVLSSAAYADNASLTVPIQMQSTGPGHYQPGIMISVAGGPPTLVNFDTGSSGLHIFASQVGNSNITYTQHHVTNSYASGVQFEGVVAYASVSIGGVVSRPIPIVVVQKVSCVAAKPNCEVAGQDSASAVLKGGFYGIMGTSMIASPDPHHPKQMLYSPIRALPGNYGSGFIIENLNANGGNLVLGINPDNSQGFNQVALPQAGTYPDGVPMYNDKALKVRYSIGEVSHELRTAFDSGGDSMVHLYTGSNIGFPARHKHIRPGYTFTGVLNQGFNWQFETGNTPSLNAIAIQPELQGKGGPYLNTGNTFFMYYDVMYNFSAGTLGFRAH